MGCECSCRNVTPPLSLSPSPLYYTVSLPPPSKDLLTYKKICQLNIFSKFCHHCLLIGYLKEHSCQFCPSGQNNNGEGKMHTIGIAMRFLIRSEFACNRFPCKRVLLTHQICKIFKMWIAGDFLVCGELQVQSVKKCFDSVGSQTQETLCFCICRICPLPNIFSYLDILACILEHSDTGRICFLGQPKLSTRHRPADWFRMFRLIRKQNNIPSLLNWNPLLEARSRCFFCGYLDKWCF